MAIEPHPPAAQNARRSERDRVAQWIVVALGLLLGACDGSSRWPVERTPNDRYVGPESPSITIVEYGDYECPPCSAVDRALGEVRRERPDIGLVFRPYPTRKHPNAVLAAEAAEAAGDQGKFWEMHATLLRRQAEWYLQPDAVGQFGKFAGDLGLDVAQFESDLESHRFRKVVETAKDTASRVGIRSLPVIFIDGVRIQNPPFKAKPILDEIERIERERKVNHS